MYIKRSLLLISLLFGLAVNVYADDFSRLTTLLNFSSFQANFTQQTMDAKKQLIQQLQGSVAMQKPKRFFWQSAQPYPQKIIANGKTVWFYDEDLQQVTVQDYAQQQSQSSLLLIFDNAQQLPQHFTLLSHQRNQDDEVFDLAIRHPSEAIEEVQLRFSQQQLMQVTLFDNLKQTTTIQFSKIVVNQEMDNALFDFVPPVGTDILYE